MKENEKNQDEILAETQSNAELPELYNKTKRIWPIIEGMILTLILLFLDADTSVIVLLWITNIVFLIEERIKTPLVNLIFKIASFVLPLILIFNLYNVYLDYKYIRLVKMEKYYNTTYEEMFDNFSTYAKWECVGNDRFTTINVNKSDRYSGGFIGQVTVSGDCYIYEEETNYILTFYISETDKDIVPVSLEIGDKNYSEDINTFLVSVYENYNENFNFE